jgi:Tol biopolymer transport system component
MMIKNLNHLGVMLAVAAGTLVAGGLLLLMLVVVVEPAGAAFPGQNGKIAFIATDARPGATFSYSIYTVNANGYPGAGLVRLTNHPVNPYSGGGNTAPAWSPVAPIPGGNKIAFSSDRAGNRGDIYTMNPSLAIEGPHGLTITPTDRLTDTPNVWEDDPAWSPDGKKIAFESNREGQPSQQGDCVGLGPCNWELYTMNSDGTGEPHRLTYHFAPDFYPAWSPDGKKIAFESLRDGSPDIYTMNSNGTDIGTGEPDRLTDIRVNEDPTWSPDGKKIAFESLHEGHREIYTMNSNGTDERPLTDDISSAPNFDPAWSPDGKKIAFVSDRELGSEIYTMNSNDGSAVHRVTNMSPLSSPMIVAEPDWQPLRETPVLPHRQLQP